MPELQLAPTIRTPRPDEVPQNQNILDKIKLRQTANIVEGFTLQNNSLHEQPFKFYSEINIDNSKLWDLFKAFLVQFPDEISFIFNHIDAETATFSPYKDKFEILNVISPYELELTQDGFLEFGIMFHATDYFEEVFIKKSKYLRYWGTHLGKFKEIMDSFSLTQIDDLNFIDEFPLVTEPLQKHNSDTISTDDLLRHLNDTLALPEN
jgi:hypothetical protein